MESGNKFEISVTKFTEESADKFYKQITEASNIDTNHPITINIDSYGGYCYSLIHMMETLSATPNPIITVCKGKAMSCGAILLAMGDHRFCGKDSSIMIHEISGGAVGHIDDIKVDAEESVRLNFQIMSQLAAKMNMTYEQLKAKIHIDGRRDWYLTADEAKSVGLVHQVGMPLIKPIIMYSVELAPQRKVSFQKEESLLPQPKKTKTRTAAVSKQKKRK